MTNDDDQRYTVSVNKPGYLFVERSLTIPAAGSEPVSINRTLDINPATKGTGKVLRNIYFVYNRASFREESYRELNQLERFMADNPDKQIQIEGHTDNIGPAAYNKDLSQRRANAVKDYLVNKGIDSRRISAVGYGEEKPLASNDDEVNGRELNRRVELVILN